MEKLLAIAADDRQTQPYPETHAFNVLTALYQDNQLGADVSPFIAQGQPHDAHHCQAFSTAAYEPLYT